MPEQYKFHYFDFRGRGEFIRYILHFAGVPYEECFIKFQWPPMEGQWQYVKPKMPMGQVPVMEFANGEMLSQSCAIARLFAKKNNLAGKDDREAAICDMYVDGVMDLWRPNLVPVYVARFKHEDKEAQAAWEKFKQESLKPFLDLYEGFVAKNEHGVLVGDKVTWADITLVECLDRFERCFDKGVLNGYSKLKALLERVQSQPSLKQYIDEQGSKYPQ